jgi:hypothetical protein
LRLAATRSTQGIGRSYTGADGPQQSAEDALVEVDAVVAAMD